MEKYWARTVRHSLLSWMFALSGADCLSFTAERQMDWGLEHEQGHGENAAPHDRAQCRPTMHGRGWHGRLLLERPRGVYHCFAQFVFLFTLLSIDCLLIICPIERSVSVSPSVQLEKEMSKLMDMSLPWSPPSASTSRSTPKGRQDKENVLPPLKEIQEPKSIFSAGSHARSKSQPKVASPKREQPSCCSVGIMLIVFYSCGATKEATCHVASSQSLTCQAFTSHLPFHAKPSRR